MEQMGDKEDMGSESQIFKFIILVSRLTANELLCFAASLPLALALSETFPCFLIFAILLLLDLARVEVSNTLSLQLLSRRTPLSLFRPVASKSPVIRRRRRCGEGRCQ